MCVVKIPIDFTINSDFFPNVQPELSLAWLCAVPVHPVIADKGEENQTSGSPQEVVESNEVSSQTSFLQTRQSKCSQPLLTRFASQAITCCFLRIEMNYSYK